MSADERPGREVAHRLFAAEYDDASLSHAESDRERAPNYVITPTGARVNRLFVVGTVTEVSSVNEDMVRARVVDPTGAFVVYAGQYQPDELAALESIEPPAFVAVTGKARTFQPEDSDRVYTSIRPESVATVDVDTRDRWVVDAAERTIDRIETYAAAAGVDAAGDALTEALLAAGVDEGPATGIPLAQSHYGTTPGYLDALRDLSIEAVEVVAGERDQVGDFDRRPDETGPEGVTFADLAGDVDLSAASPEPEEAESAADAATDEPAAAETTVAGSATETSGATEPSGATETAGTPDDHVESEDSIDEPEEADEAAAADEASVGEPAAAEDETAAEEPVTTGEPEGEEPVAADGEEPVADGDEPASADASGAADDLGDFDVGDEMYEMDDEERERIESEYGAEFSTGAEVDDPGEADIDAPDETLENGAEEAPSAGAEVEPASDEPAESNETPASDVDAAETEPDDATETADSAPDADSEPAGPESDEEAADSAEGGEEPTEDADESAEDEDETVEDEPAAEADAPAEDVDVQDLVVETMTELDEGEGADRAAVVERVVERTGLSEAEVEDAIQDALMGGQCYEPDDETLKAI